MPLSTWIAASVIGKTAGEPSGKAFDALPPNQPDLPFHPPSPIPSGISSCALPAYARSGRLTLLPRLSIASTVVALRFFLFFVLFAIVIAIAIAVRFVVVVVTHARPSAASTPAQARSRPSLGNAASLSPSLTPRIEHNPLPSPLNILPGSLFVTRCALCATTRSAALPPFRTLFNDFALHQAVLAISRLAQSFDDTSR